MKVRYLHFVVGTRHASLLSNHLNKVCGELDMSYTYIGLIEVV